MEETGKTAASESKVDTLEQKLANMEALLGQQLAETKKMARYRGIMALLMLCLVVVFAVGLFALNSTVAGATRELPQLITATENTARQLEQTLQDVSSIDFEGLNKTIGDMDKGLGAVDFEALNAAVLDLQKTAEGLANFTSLFR